MLNPQQPDSDQGRTPTSADAQLEEATESTTVQADSSPPQSDANASLGARYVEPQEESCIEYTLRGARNGQTVRIPEWFSERDDLDTAIEFRLPRPPLVGPSLVIDENALFNAHYQTCPGLRPPTSAAEIAGLRSKGAAPATIENLRLESKVLERLVSDFRAWLDLLTDRLDGTFEEHEQLRPVSIYIPQSRIIEPLLTNRAVTEAELGRPLREQRVMGVFTPQLRGLDEPDSIANRPLGSPQSKVYTFLVQLRNKDGFPVIAFTDSLNCHGQDAVTGLEIDSSQAGSPSSLIRVYKRIPIGKEREFLDSDLRGDFITQYLLSPESFEFELDQLRQGGMTWFQTPILGRREHRPYLAQAIDHAIVAKTPGLTLREVDVQDIRCDPDSRARNSFLVQANDGFFRVRLSHSAPPHNKDAPDYMINFSCDRLERGVSLPY